MENSPFNRSARTTRTPPPSTPPTVMQTPISSEPIKTIPTPELQQWMTSIDLCLNEVCSIATEGKLNSDQKMRISSLCRKVGQSTSQLVVQYMSLKMDATKAQTSIVSLQNQLDLSQKLQELKNSIEESSKPDSGTSFADMVKKGGQTLIRPKNLSTLAIYPRDKSKSSDDTKCLLQKIISPEELKLHVRGMRKVKNGGVIISAERKGDIDKLKNSEKLVSSGLTMEEPTKRRPRIAIVGVPLALTDKEVFECIFEQNIADKFPKATRDSFLATVKLSHKSGKKNLLTCNYIIEVPPSIRKALINQGRIYINWTSCPVRDFTIVTRCFNCQQFGHSAKFCRESCPTCNYCGELGHSFKECNNKAHASVCATCKRFKRKCDHKTGDESCPARKFAEEKYINSIDYEGA
ncbi:unnamed protein product [Parnassius mnemosyne]|uniref:CCHC-type domain-containing protein n=1 Tax=Parnassius mnemosyne TaxID=213953 RepID=A0AAV1LUQ8_9NEOP